MTGPNDFVHLHNHFHTSRLDGHQLPSEGLAAAAEAGQRALAMTDHGTCNGHYHFYQDARKADIIPILGCEIYLAPTGPDGEPSDRFARKPITWQRIRSGTADDEQAEGKGVAGAGKYTHQTLLAVTDTGLRNLWSITSKASRDGFYGNPRADHALLREHADGIVATTGCPSGELQTRLRLGQDAQARQVIERDLEIFGRDRFYVEVMDHGIEIERQVRNSLLDIMKRYKLQPLATNDSHYARRTDADAHDALLAVQSGKKLHDPTRWRFGTDPDEQGLTQVNDSYYIRSAAEMRHLFDTEIPGACDNTLLVAEMVTADTYTPVFAPKNRMPVYRKVPAGLTAEEYLRDLVYEGLRARYGAELSAEVVDRTEFELKLIISEGFVHYFLVLWDICRFMRERGILFGPRGSAAGSIVIYSLAIAAMDPLRFGLMFERFINPARIGPPDVDIDIDDHRRGEVIQYVIGEYGPASTAAIITFGILGGKASIKDAARILDQPVSVGDTASKAYPPPLFGKSVFLHDVYDEAHPRYDAGAPLRDLADADPAVGEVVAKAKQIEGRLRVWNQHACGFIASADELMGQIPLDFDHKTGMARIGFEYPDAEEMGLSKFDALGLRNLRILANAIDWVRKNHGVEIDLDDESFDDPAVYELLRKGHTLSVFQLESGGMQRLLRMIEPDGFADIMAVGALYRPGPMGMESHTKYALRKTGRQRIDGVHPELETVLEKILAETFGVITFQEQVMQAVQAVADFTPGKADILRKAMGKKKKAELDKMRVEFDAGAQAKGFSAEAADALWGALEPFADYAFNKCVSKNTYIARLGMGSHDWPQTVENVANRVHGRQDYDGTGCRYCYNEAGRPVPSRSRECEACQSWRAQWRVQGGMDAAGRVGDRVLPVKIVDVFRQGVKRLWKMTLGNGMSITTTANHRHLTPRGWRRLDRLRVGDHVSVMADGEKVRGIEASEIVSIEYVGEEMTYDVTVHSDDHSWVANGGIITHNSHTACYGRIAYWTAYLKAHFPTEYMASVLDAEAGNKSKLGIYLGECRRMKIPVLVPDINESTGQFTPTADGIRFGLAGIRDVGTGVVDGIIDGRRQRPYQDFIDFLERSGRGACTKKAVIALIEGGAFDSIESNRAVLLDAAEKGALAAARAKKIAENGQVDLFTAAAPAEYDEDGAALERVLLTGVSINRNLPPLDRLQQLDRERDRLGLYLSGHPLDGKEATLAAHRTETTAELLAYEPELVGDQIIDRNFRLAGTIAAVEVKARKKDGAPFAVVTIEDLDGAIDVMFFVDAYAAVKDQLIVGSLVTVAGRTWGKIAGGDEPEGDDGTIDDLAPPSIEVTYKGRFVDPINVLDPDTPVGIRVPYGLCTPRFVDELQRIIARHPGTQRLDIHLLTADRTVHPWRPAELRVDLSLPLVSELKAHVGATCVSRTPRTT